MSSLLCKVGKIYFGVTFQATFQEYVIIRDMGWRDGRFYYTKKVLKGIAENYFTIYDGLPTLNREIMNPWGLAEFKADFDMALNGLGRGYWDGGPYYEFKECRHFGHLQRIVIANLIGVGDDELVAWGFYDVPRLRDYAYYLMCCFLNGTRRIDDSED